MSHTINKSSNFKDKNPLVSIIILTYNSSKFLSKCLDSIARQTYRNFEIIIVDNASVDGSAELAKKIGERMGLTRFTVVRNSRNLGYCGGNNVGIRLAKGKYIAIINPDIILNKHWLERLVAVAESNDKIGMCQGKILYDNTKIINSTGNLMDIFGAVRCRGEFEIDRGQYDNNSGDFFYVSGAAFLIRKDVLYKVGLFDEMLFLYHDDVDLSWRVRLLGYVLKYISDAVCFHIKRINKKFIYEKINRTKMYYVYRNRLIIMLKNYAFKNVIKYVPLALILNILNSIYLTLLKRDCYLYLQIKATFDVILKLREILINRKKIQSLRKVDDDDILKYISFSPIELLEFKAIIQK